MRVSLVMSRIERLATPSQAEPRTSRALPSDRRKRRYKSGVSSNRTRTDSSTVPGVTEPDATGLSPATIGPRDASPHVGQVVRRVLLRRNIVIDAETAQLVVAAVQAALQPVRLPSRRARVGAVPPPTPSRCSDNG